ncbi:MULTISPECIES: DUF3560 domain-containing protein [Cysteiniphilum]|uniref:DUF3560 domain-containing protein n=1 Tax=Cysteiniphilum litorale TaxID=2056700 RepID=A0A8J2Z2T8_9GAMM|nr:MULTISPECIES: DUF3560 domain-containing protein [Cysteiniphilum]GGF91435.1 hypothetical protein GCM10010995_05830 [Cysteiniphilum litorale]
MNSYEERQEARKQRYKEKAQELAHLSNELAEESSKMARAIPFGQPILVGHHSEKSDRSYRAKIGAKMDKAVAAQDKAEYYAQKAESVGKGGISNYDPEAAEKIKEKIESLKSENERMKDINKQWRKIFNKIAKPRKTISKYGEYSYLQEEERKACHYAIKDFKQVDEVAAKKLYRVLISSSHWVPYYLMKQPYKTDTAEIRRLEQRLELLEKYADKSTQEVEKNGYKCTQDPEEMRVMFEFDGKPSEEVRDILKRNGFKWSRYACAWVRKLTPNASYQARLVMQSLDKLAGDGGE